MRMQRVQNELLFLSLILILFSSCRDAVNSAKDYSEWKTYAGSKDGIRYSSNNQITRENVQHLQRAWIYSTQDKDTGNRSQNQCSPIIINGILYGTSPASKLFALDAATGVQRWLFDPAASDKQGQDPMAYYKVCRGVVYWQNERGGEQRIFYSAGNKTYAIDASTGRPIEDFGPGGYIDLSDNLDRDKDSNAFVAGTTPGIIYKDLLIVGIRVAETVDAAPGHIRAYDTRTGKRKWIFHTIPHPGEKGYETWEDPEAWKKLGGANNWAGMALDEENGILYVPTGSVGGDFYGGNRKGQNLFSNSLIALDASTGKYLWHYQVVHHDLWDRDLPANPNLVTIYPGGKKVDAVAQISKQGYIFLFDRRTGAPVFPIVETPVPTDALPGEQPWPTQPIPSLPEPFARQKFDAEEVADLDSQSHQDMLALYRSTKYNTRFMPPSKAGGWLFPGFDGGGEWGGAAVDPESQILYVNCSELPWSLKMMDAPLQNKNVPGAPVMGDAVYAGNCISCHGPDLKGNGSTVPSLLAVEQKYNEQQILQILDNGRNRMPSFKQFTKEEKKALLSFLGHQPAKENHSVIPMNTAKEPPGVSGKDYAGQPYMMTGYNRFTDKNGYPGIKPPWGTLNAVDLNSGKLLWKVPLGEYPELTKRGIPVTGTENYGGPLVTRGGLVFIAATKDGKIRAFDKAGGKILWEAQLPVPGYASPAAYVVNGKEYIVIACGGGKIGSPSGDQYIAFALPEKENKP